MAAGTVACHRTPGEAERQLIYIDSLIASAPDSALTLLAALSPSPDPQPAGTSETSGESSPSKLEGARGSVSASDEASPVRMTAGERAYHALLTAQAMYKAYIPATTDSVINVAWDYYGHLGMFASATDRQRRVRAMLYKGTTAEELGHPDSAMYWYKRTELEAAPDDHYHRGYALMNMGYLYQSQANCDKFVIDKFKAALNCFCKSEKWQYLYLISLGEIGANYRNVNKDSAFTYIYKAIRQSELDDNKSLFYCNLNSLAGLYYGLDSFNNCKRYAAIVANDGSQFTDSTCFYYLSIACSKLGEYDSANFYLSKSRLPRNMRDTLLRNQALFLSDPKNANAKNQFPVESDNIVDSLSRKTLKAEFALIESQCIMEDSNLSHSKSIQYILICFAIIIFIFFALAAYRNRARKQQLKQLEDEINAAKNELATIIADNESLQSSNDLFVEYQTQVYKKVLQALTKNKTDIAKRALINETMSQSFIQILYKCVNLKYNNLADFLIKSNRLNERDINIACMHFCKLPNFVIMCYMNVTIEHSVTTRKNIIAKKILGNSNDINDIPKLYVKGQIEL